jgi:hypothetical protein
VTSLEETAGRYRGPGGLVCVLAGFGQIWGLSAGQGMIGHFVGIFWLDSGSFNQPGVKRRLHVLKPAPWLGEQLEEIVCLPRKRSRT